MAKKEKQKKGKTGGPIKDSSVRQQNPKKTKTSVTPLSSLVIQVFNHPLIKKFTHPIILMVVCLIMTFIVHYYVAPFYAKGPDSFQYMSLAKDMANGSYFKREFDIEAGLINSRRVVPLFPSMIAVGTIFGSDPEIAGSWVTIIMGTLTIIPLFSIGMRLGSKISATATCLFFTWMPLNLEVSGHILTESTFGFFTVSTVWATIRAIEKPSPIRMALVGLTCTLAYLTRDIGFGNIFIAIFLLGTTSIFLKRPWKKTLICAGAGIIVFSLCSAPFWLLIKVHTGKFSPTLRTVNNIESDMMGYQKGGKSLISNSEGNNISQFSLVKVVVKTVKLTWEYTRTTFKRIPKQFFVFALIGIIMGVRAGPEKWAKESVPLLFALGIMFAYGLITPYMVDIRYYLPVTVLAAIWAGRGCAHLPLLATLSANDDLPFPQNRRLMIKGTIGISAIFVLALVSSIGFGYYIKSCADYTKFIKTFNSPQSFINKTVSGHKEASLEARQMLFIKPGARILARKPYFAYYLDGRHVDIAETVEGVKKQILDGDCDYVAIGSLSVYTYRPGLKPLVTETDPLPGAPLVYRKYLEKYNKLISIYKVGGKGINIGEQIAQHTPAQHKQDIARALQYYKQGHIEHTRQILTAVIKQDPQNFYAYPYLIKVYMIYGYFDYKSLAKAEEALKQYSLLRPNAPNITTFQISIQKIKDLYK